MWKNYGAFKQYDAFKQILFVSVFSSKLRVNEFYQFFQLFCGCLVWKLILGFGYLSLEVKSSVACARTFKDQMLREDSL